MHWPRNAWETSLDRPGIDTDRLDGLLAHAFADPQPADLAETRAVVVVQGGSIVAEQYAPGITAVTPLRSWSVAKSVLAALVGVLVGQGRLSLDEPVAVPEWADPSDPRHAITLGDLLTMRAGLEWSEDYTPNSPTSDVIAMLWGAGAADTAHYAASKPLVEKPGSTLLYSSGVTNIISRLLGEAVATDRGGGPEGFRAWADLVLFGPLGMQSVDLRFDDAGTWIASSFLWATARDYARFGLLHCRHGLWDGRRVLPMGWIDQICQPSGTDPDGDVHGAHWWLLPHPEESFMALGYDQQYVIVVPERDLVVVRLGKTPSDHRPAVRAWLGEVIDCVADPTW